MRWWRPRLRRVAPTRTMPAHAMSAGVDSPDARRIAPNLVFTPTRPKLGDRFAAGRSAELGRILRALREDRAHVVLYSERGRGKTSLANMVVAALRRDGLIVARHSCEAGSDFESILRGLLRDLPAALLAAPPVPGREGCESALPPGPLRASDVPMIPSRLTCRGLIGVIDEFDRVEDPATRSKLADAIKQLSDQDAPLKFLLVGVSNNLDEILGQHPSIQRTVRGVPLPLLTDAEVAGLVTTGGAESGYRFGPEIVDRVVRLARGMPYMVQLLALRLTQTAADRGGRTISEDDWHAVVAGFLAEAGTRVRALLNHLTEGGADAEMVRALRRIADASQDRFGRIAMTPAGAWVRIGDRLVPASCWNRCLEAGAIVPAHGEAGLFIFAERWLMHYVLAASEDAPSEGGRATASDAEPVLLNQFASKG